MATGVRSGVLLAVLGLWLIMRATHQDTTSHHTLIDKILGAGSGWTPAQVGAGQFRAQVAAAGGPTLMPLTPQEKAALAAATSPNPTPANMGAPPSSSQGLPSVLGPRTNPRLASAQAQINGAMNHVAGIFG